MRSYSNELSNAPEFKAALDELQQEFNLKLSVAVMGSVVLSTIIAIAIRYVFG